MSGTSRQYMVLPPHFFLLERPERITPGPFCHEGLRNSTETPPPPAPRLTPWPPHTFSWMGPVAVSCVPPTPVAYGWPAGSSTARSLTPWRWQSEEPSSPEAAKNEMPLTASSSSSWFVDAASPSGSNGWHRPQLSDT